MHIVGLQRIFPAMINAAVRLYGIHSRP
jgi:hypothetical protein